MGGKEDVFLSVTVPTYFWKEGGQNHKELGVACVSANILNFWK
jgi:hypothetical protein